jgi:broad specificity phosphatase PhoE
MNIYLVRHGETDWNTKLLFQGHTDIKLNKNGLRQAQCIAKELKNADVEAVISSDLFRAFQTAEEISKAHSPKLKIEKMEGLRERNYGNLEGKLYDRYHSQGKDFTGEKDGKFFARVNKAFSTIMEKYTGKNIVVVTHGGVVRQIISHVLGLKDYKKLRVYNASLSEIYYNDKKKGFFLLGFNSVAHLPRKERNKIQYHIKGI